MHFARHFPDALLLYMTLCQKSLLIFDTTLYIFYIYAQKRHLPFLIDVIISKLLLFFYNQKRNFKIRVSFLCHGRFLLLFLCLQGTKAISSAVLSVHLIPLVIVRNRLNQISSTSLQKYFPQFQVQKYNQLSICPRMLTFLPRTAIALQFLPATRRFSCRQKVGTGCSSERSHQVRCM